MSETKHAKYGGSTAARTIGCPAWHKLAEDCPKPNTSDVAKLGTALHHIVEKCLLNVETDPYEFAGQVIEGVTITDEHIDTKIYPALDMFEELMDRYDIDRYHTEVYISMREDIGGTVDFIGFSADNKTVVVADYKSGDGVLVDAEDNSQGLFYAMCARDQRFKEVFTQADTLVIAIVQPSERRESMLDMWETDMKRLDTFKKDYLNAVKISEAGDTQATLGSHCSFCPAAAFCPAKTGLVTQAEKLPVDSLKLEELARALDMADHIEKWLSAVRKTAYEQLSKGVPIEGYKLVAKRATRSWTDQQAVVDEVKKMRKLSVTEIHDMKLLSPAQIEKVCKSKGIDFDRFKENITTASSGTTLAKASDSRPAAMPTAAAKLIAERFAS